MANSFLATFQYVKGGGTIIPFTGIRQTAESTPAIVEIGRYCDTVVSLKQPAGNVASILTKVTNPSFLSPPSLGALLVQTIGLTMDLAFTKFSTTLVPPTPSEVLSFYRSVSTLIIGTSLDIVIPRYIAASFVNGEG